MRNINFRKFLVMLGCTLMLGTTAQAQEQVQTQEQTQEQAQYIEPSNTAVGETITDNSYDSILQIIVTCTDDDGNVIPVTGGSGFLIGDDDTSLQYLLTAKSAVTVPSLGNIGGPIVDENGTVLAINITRNDGLNFYAVDIREVMDTLDSFSVTYTTITQEEEKKLLISIFDRLFHKGITGRRQIHY
jgi:hypothetical protein